MFFVQPDRLAKTFFSADWSTTFSVLGSTSSTLMDCQEDFLRRARKYRQPTTFMWALFVLACAVKFSVLADSFVNLNDISTNTPITNEITDLVSRKKSMTLCSNNGAPGTFIGFGKKTLIPKMDLPHRAVTCFIVLSICGDIELNPGPVSHKDIFPCGWCELNVGWSCAGVCCDQCDLWYHKQCISMSSAEYEGLADESWKCLKCTTVNCSSFLYNGYNLNIENSFQVLSNIPGDDSVFEMSMHTVDSPSAPRHSSPVTSHTVHHSGPNLSSVSSGASTSTQPHVTATRSANPAIKQANFRTIVVNCNSVKGKQAELAHLLSYTDADAVLMCETKLDSSVSVSEFLPPNYQCIARKDRNIHGGGVLIAIKSNFIAEEVEIKSEGEIVWAKVTLSTGHAMYIGSFYNNDGSTRNVEFLEKSLTDLSSITKNNPNTFISLGGDFNAHGIDWDSGILNLDCHHRSACTKLVDVQNEFSLTQMQVQPSREKSILDLYFLNKPSLVKSCKVIPGISDHNVVVVDCNIQAQISKKPPHKVYKWDKAPWDLIREKTVLFGENFIQNSTQKNVAENYASIETHFQEIMKLVPHKMSRSRIDLPWFNQNLKREGKRRQRLYKMCKQLGNAKTDRGKKKRSEYEAQLAKSNKSFQSNLKRARWQYINNILCTSLESGNNKPFWKYIRGVRQESVGVAPLKEDGVLHSDREKKSEILAKQFRSVFTNDDTDPYSGALPTGRSYGPISQLSIGENGICKLLENLSPNKAVGPDQIPCRLLKELAPELAPVLSSLFRQSLSTGELPDSWLTAWIAPVFKKGPKNEPANYRPVSLTCVICKVLEHVVCSHMRSHFDNLEYFRNSNMAFGSISLVSLSSWLQFMTSWPGWTGRSRWMWQCWISARHSTLSPIVAFSGSWNCSEFMGSCSPGYGPS